MKKILWATDLHLNFVSASTLNNFFASAKHADALIVTGDIGEGNKKSLTALSEGLPNTDIFFVLGNHDYYGQSFNDMNKIVTGLCKKINNLHWLTEAPNGFTLINDIPVIGHEGWYDCLHGKTGRVILNDFTYIKDIRRAYLTGVEQLMIDEFRKVATTAAEHFISSLEKAFKLYDRAVLVTHVPPFPEAAWHQGRLCEEAWLPFMSSKLAGDAIYTVMKNNPNKNLLVLCGHTHSCGETQILPNLKVMTGRAVYRFPEIYKDLGDLSV